MHNVPNGAAILRPVQQQPQQIAVAQPLNDVQLVALVAASLAPAPEEVERAVRTAQDIVFHAVTKQDVLGKRIQEWRDAQKQQPAE